MLNKPAEMDFFVAKYSAKRGPLPILYLFEEAKKVTSSEFSI